MAGIHGSQGKNSQCWEEELAQKPWRNTAYWLASHWLAQPTFYSTREQELRGDSTHSAQGPHTSIINAEKETHHSLPTGQPRGAFSQPNFPSQMTQVCRIDIKLVRTVDYISCFIIYNICMRNKPFIGVILNTSKLLVYQEQAFLTQVHIDSISSRFLFLYCLKFFTERL